MECIDAALVDLRRRVDELLRRLTGPGVGCLASDGKISVPRTIVELADSDGVPLRTSGLRMGVFSTVSPDGRCAVCTRLRCAVEPGVDPGAGSLR